MITKDLSVVDFNNHLSSKSWTVPAYEARYIVEVKYKKYNRGQSIRGEDQRKFTVGTVRKYYNNPEKMLEWADGFPRNRVVSPITVECC